ncbi:MAG: protocatechuate 3,4-dioxygenase subunit alpha [Rhodobacteraceae bacterium]|nr:protocatechuate 3,4-dioxygenase subunit alpha [Paracoccaceae bacterium]
MTMRETPSQTAGPYVHIGCLPEHAGLARFYDAQVGASPIATGAKGAEITITGTIIDGMGGLMRDAMIETWQADAAGLFPGEPGADPAVSGFARMACDADSGAFTLKTIKPGATGGGAPHISVWIVARGINIGLQTRIYFEDEVNGSDPLLSRIDPPQRAGTLIARNAGPGAYRFDIRLRGDGETVFLDL